MQEQNKVSIDYFKVKERFADLINGFVYHGKQAVREEDIVELDPVLPVSVRQGQAVAFHGNVNIVDLMRQVRVKCHVVLVALQNQSEIHYAMPVRVMSTDAGKLLQPMERGPEGTSGRRRSYRERGIFIWNEKGREIGTGVYHGSIFWERVLGRPQDIKGNAGSLRA